MSIRSALWKVGTQPQQLAESILPSERLLEEMIIAAPGLLSDEWMLIGRQESTGFNGRIDLLAIAPDGGLILIEIKRDRTSREVVAQALDYASWIQSLKAPEIVAAYGRFAPGRDLAHDFRTRFGRDLDEDSINENHQIVIVAGELDPSTERIINYLSEREIAINVLFFQVFTIGGEQLISRSWLQDPLQAQAIAASARTGPAEAWNNEFYHSFGAGGSRSWEDAQQYGFISGGGGAWYSRTLKQLSPGDRVWVNVPGSGYVGVGRVTSQVQAARDFRVATSEGEKTIYEASNLATYHAEYIDDPEQCEYFVPIHWSQTVPLNKAVQELGLFGNQNTVCRPTAAKWRTTVERLKVFFPQFDN